MDLYTLTKNYAGLFAALSPDTLDQLEARLSEEVIFTDPFNILRGRQEFIAIFVHMFAVMDRPAFAILDVAASEQAGYIKWEMTGCLKSRPSFEVRLVGLSELVFDEAGLLLAHHDHWDSAHQLLRHIPVAGWFVGKLLGLFALPKKYKNW